MKEGKEKTVSDYLMNEIETGNLHPGDKIPSEFDLTEKFGFNKWTVNRAVACLVERGILIRRIGRGGTVVAPRHKRPRGAIAYLTQLLSGHTFGAQMMQGAAEGARARGYSLQYYQNNGEEVELWKEIADSGAAGVLATCTSLPPHAFPLPVIEVGNTTFPNHVMSDDRTGGRQLAEFVLKRGHRRPLIVTEYMRDLLERPRIAGMYEHFQKAGIHDMSSRIIITNSLTVQNPDAVYRSVIEHDPKCTVLLFPSDTAAFSFIQYLESHGIMIPEQLSITGYANMREYQVLRQITTIHQYPEDIGFQSASALIDIIEGIQKEPIQKLTSTTLIPGSTVK